MHVAKVFQCNGGKLAQCHQGRNSRYEAARKSSTRKQRDETKIGNRRKSPEGCWSVQGLTMAVGSVQVTW